jgi:mono/diheme cytochrome c family protein
MRRSLSTLVVPALAAIVYAACGGSSGSGSGAAPAPSAPSRPAAVTEANVALGDSLFNTGPCQRCHGQKGVGAANGPSLVTSPWLHSTGSFDEIAATITNGVPRASIKDATRRFQMNPRGGPMNLTDAQVQAIAAYVWSISRDKK